MKKIMKTGFGKRLPLGIGLLLAAVLLGIYLPDHFLGAESLLWHRIVWIVAVLGTGIAALGYLIFGWKGLLGAYGWIAALALLPSLPEILPPSWAGLCYAVLLGAFLLFRFYRKKNGGKSTSKKKKEKKVPQEALPEEEEEEASLPEDSDVYLVRFSVSDRNYQLIRCPGQIRAYRVGGELRGVVPELLQDPTKPLRPLDKHDIVFPLDSDLSVTFREKHDTRFESPLLSVRLKTAKRGYTMFPLLPSEEENARLRQFIEANISQREDKVKKELPGGEPNPQRVIVLRKAVIGLSVFAALVDLPFLFMNVPYRLFAALSLLPTLILLALYCIFPYDFTLTELKREEKKRVAALFPLLLFSMPVCLRGLMDFNILRWGRVFLVAGILLGVLLLAALLLSKEWRRRKVAILNIFLALLFYTLGATLLTNYLFDRSAPVEQLAVVEDMRISTASKGPDNYYLELIFPDGTGYDLDVGKTRYGKTKVGDTVTVETYSGAWGIPYAFVK